MVETIGKKLCQARLEKGLTIDEAAHATKMRPDKILALENDDYSRFGNNAYAKGFLQIYGRFLDVEVARQMRDLETPTTVSVDDYQYLNNPPEPQKVYLRPERKAGPPSVIPLLVVVMALFLGIGGFWIYVSAQRLGLDKPPSHPPDHSTEKTEKPEAASPVAPPAERPVAPTAPSAPLGGHHDVLADSRPPVPAPGAPDTIEVRRAEPVASAGDPKLKNEPITTAGAVNEVVVEPIKKTWVTIRKGRPDSAPVFEDYLYPGAPPLKLHGTKFFVEVRDQTAVQIRKNGSPIAYQAPGISIQ